MASILQLKQKLEKLKVEELVEEALNNSAEDILLRQKLQQSKGLGSDGKPFINKNSGTDEYSPGYAKKKGRKKPIDLFSTGDFKNAEFMDVRKDVIVLDSADEKTEKLIKQFGEGIFGLNEESRVKLKPFIQPELKNVIISNIKKL